MAPTSTLALVSFISLIALSSAVTTNHDKMIQMTRRSPAPIPESGNGNFQFSGLIKRDPQATAAKVVIGTSNPPPQALNTLGDSTPSLGKTNGVITPFKAGAGQKVKRQATAPFVAIGKSNPPAPAQELNVLGDSTPALGKTNGVITPFKAGAVVKRQATQPFVALGTSNPSIASSDLNEVDDSDASTESADGALESFGAANVNVDFENQGDDTINEKRNLNLISHHLATRGHADGTIELF